jgi:hypothetical protein
VITPIEGSIYFFEGQKRRFINLDETDASLDDTKDKRGGRPSVTFSAPELPAGSTQASKCSYSATIIAGSAASGDTLSIPPHFQYKSLAKTDDGQRSYSCFALEK